MALPVERIRVVSEHELGRVLRSYSSVRQLETHWPRETVEDNRAWVRSHCVRITADDAPGIHRELDRARVRLGVKRHVEVYMGGTGFAAGDVNARMFTPSPDRAVPLMIQLSTEAAKKWRGAELCDVFGHELGHAIAHLGPASDGTRSYELARRIMSRRDPPPRLRAAAEWHSLACEMTADRMGLLASRDLCAAARVEMIATTRAAKRDIPASPESFIAQAKEVVEESLETGRWLFGTSHPSEVVRVYARWLFSESDMFRELTDDGPGRIDDAALAERTRALVALMDPRRSEKVGRAQKPPQPERAKRERASVVPDEVDGSGARELVEVALFSLDQSLGELKDGAVGALKKVGSRLGEKLQANESREPDDSEDDPYKADVLRRFEELERKLKADADGSSS